MLLTCKFMTRVHFILTESLIGVCKYGCIFFFYLSSNKKSVKLLYRALSIEASKEGLNERGYVFMTWTTGGVSKKKQHFYNTDVEGC